MTDKLICAHINLTDVCLIHSCQPHSSFELRAHSMESNDKIIIRTHFNHKFAFIILDHEDLSVENFMIAGKQVDLLNISTCSLSKNYKPFSAQSKFNINGDLRVSVLLSDNFHTKISKDDFCDIVRNFCKSGSFYVNLEYEIIQQNPAHVTKEVSVRNGICQIFR